MFIVDEDLAEETGIHVGDGSMNIYANNRAYYTVACHHIDDKEYLDTVVLPLVKRIYEKSPKPRLWSQGTWGFRICSLELVLFKHNILELPLGKKHGIVIPTRIHNNRKLMIAFIRGLFDTDGCMFIETKRGKKYPCIMLSNISEQLVFQVTEFLRQEGFLVTYWHHKPRKCQRIHRISINGARMLEKWLKLIGFHNPKHLKKIMLFKENSL